MSKSDPPVSTESKFQGSFLMLHVYAAALAAVAMVMHIAAAYYHARRWRNSVQEPAGSVILPFRARVPFSARVPFRRKRSLHQRIA